MITSVFAAFLHFEAGSFFEAGSLGLCFLSAVAALPHFAFDGFSSSTTVFSAWTPYSTGGIPTDSIDPFPSPSAAADET